MNEQPTNQPTSDELIDNQAVAQIIEPPAPPKPELPQDQIRAALVKAWGDFPSVVHDRINTAAGSSGYATLDSVIKTIKPAFKANGLMPSQRLTTYPNEIGVITMIIHASGQVMEFPEIVMPVVGKRIAGGGGEYSHNNGPQEFGSSITYARRYSLLAALGISTGDDDDAHAAQHGGNKSNQRPPNQRGQTGNGANRVRNKINKPKAKAEPKNNPLGDDRAVGLEKHADANGVSMTQIRDHLVKNDYADLAEQDASQWPESIAGLVNKFIKENAKETPSERKDSES